MSTIIWNTTDISFVPFLFYKKIWTIKCVMNFNVKDHFVSWKLTPVIISLTLFSQNIFADIPFVIFTSYLTNNLFVLLWNIYFYHVWIKHRQYYSLQQMHWNINNIFCLKTPHNDSSLVVIKKCMLSINSFVYSPFAHFLFIIKTSIDSFASHQDIYYHYHIWSNILR